LLHKPNAATVPQEAELVGKLTAEVRYVEAGGDVVAEPGTFQLEFESVCLA
jgi:hypothetical protein